MEGFTVTKSIYIKLIVFLFLIFTISMISYHFISFSLSNEKNISHIINSAGRERMLVEEINKKAIQMVFMKHDNSWNEIQQSVHEFETNFYDLKSGSKQLGLVKRENEEIDEQFQYGEQDWKRLKDALNLLLIENDIESQKLIIEDISKTSNQQIEHLDILVKLFEQQGREKFKGLNTEKLSLILSNLLLVIVLFVTWRLFTNIKKSETRYRLLIDHAPMGIVTVTDDKINFINKLGLKTLGAFNSFEVVGKSIFDFINSQNSSVGKDKLTEEKCKRLDDSEINIEMVTIPFEILGDKTKMIIFNDITEKIQSKNKAENIYTELTNIRSALEVSSIVEVVDRNGTILYVNDKFCDISKYNKADVIGKTHRMLSSGYHSKEFYKDMWDTILQGQVWEGQVKNKGKNRKCYWVQTIIVPFINNQGEPYQFITIRNDITDRKKAEKEIRKLATQDHLTRLSNRRKFEYELQKAINIGESIAVLFLDLDRFKFINDTLGHSIGDELIKLVAKRLEEVVDRGSIVSRQGGDEFTILLKSNDKEYITNLANKIIETIKHPFIIGHREILITCSIGISVYPDHGKDIETLMKNADVAMYSSKDKGKDNFSYYQEHMEKRSARIMQLEMELRKAVENKEFVLYYQPKVALSSGEIVGFEALIRWEHPTLGIISPGEFIPLAEETGIINEMGEWVLREACIQNKKWHDMGYSEFVIAVNISAHQLKHVNLTEVVEKILTETQLESRFLELELTESISMLNQEDILKQLYALKAVGVSLAIDDFGTGYSSLKYLEKFPVDTLKIDKSFIDEIDQSKHFKSALMTNAIISLAKSLHMVVVAEGIEYAEQMEYLKRHNCDLGQGYFISRPLPASELEEKFIANNNKGYFAV